MKVYIIHYSDFDGEYGNEDTIRIAFQTKKMAERFILNAGFAVDNEREGYVLDSHYSSDFGIDNGCAWIQEYTFEEES